MMTTRIPAGALSRLQQIDRLKRHRGHAHFWDRAFSRRQFVQTAASAAGLMLAAPLSAATSGVPGNTPKPIPGGFQPFGPGTEVFHIFAPNVFDPPDTDRSGIFDFKGKIGYAIIDGMGTARTRKGPATRMPFEVDVRFMQGVYIGEDRRRRHGTFCFS
jgi:hypothetical protein